MWLSKQAKNRFEIIILDIFDMIAFLIFVGGIVLFVRFFVANPYTVIGKSMAPTFQEKDFIIVDKITPRFGELHRWDIIVFVAPGKTDPYIKRIIGLPGEVVKFKDSKVFICAENNGREICDPLEEKYLPDSVRTEAKCGKTEFEITPGWLFVMWDNRWLSTDSLCCFGLGCYEWANYLVPYGNIIWKVYVRLFPHFERY